jgi:hypothetical protein
MARAEMGLVRLPRLLIVGHRGDDPITSSLGVRAIETGTHVVVVGEHKMRALARAWGVEPSKSGFRAISWLVKLPEPLSRFLANFRRGRYDHLESRYWLPEPPKRSRAQTQEESDNDNEVAERELEFEGVDPLLRLHRNGECSDQCPFCRDERRLQEEQSFWT